MNDTLKVAGRIGAELGAAKAENEAMRWLLQQVVDCQAEHYGDGCGLHLSMITLAGRIKDAISQQAEPVRSPRTEDTASMDSNSAQGQFTAVDMATAAAQGFRDGQAAVEQAAVQDELPAGGVTIEKDIFGTAHIKMGDFDYIQIQYQYPYTDNASQNALAKRIAELLTRPAQTAPQPEQSALVLPRAQLERIERRLTDWLELNCCECESGHLCGRNEVTADRDAIRAALSAQGGQQ